MNLKKVTQNEKKQRRNVEESELISKTTREKMESIYINQSTNQ